MKILMIVLFGITSFIVMAQEKLAPVDRNYIQPRDYGPNSHRIFLIPVNDVDLPENVRLDFSEITFVDRHGSITHTIDAQGEIRAGSKASFGARMTWEKWKMNEGEAERIGSEKSGSNFGDLDFIAKFKAIDTKINGKELKVGGTLILKTTSGDDLNNRYTDTMGGSGTIDITRELIKSKKLRLYGFTNFGFGGLDTHKKSSAEIGGETGQDDLFVYQARFIAFDEDLFKDLDVKLSAGVVGYQGWFGKESGDQVMNCDIQVDVAKKDSGFAGFLRFGKDIIGINPVYVGAGIRMNIKAKEK